MASPDPIRACVTRRTGSKPKEAGRAWSARGFKVANGFKMVLRAATICGLVVTAVMNSPYGYTKAGESIAPLTALACFIKESIEQKNIPQESTTVASMKGLLFPGNAWQAWLSEGGVDRDLVFSSGLELAMKNTSWFESAERHQLLICGSWCVLLGAVFSLFARRVHFLALLGLGLNGYALVSDGHSVSLQFLLLTTLATAELATRAEAMRPGAAEDREIKQD